MFHQRVVAENLPTRTQVEGAGYDVKIRRAGQQVDMILQGEYRVRLVDMLRRTNGTTSDTLFYAIDNQLK